jgi:DNA-binding IclR family transcriptional regulator
MTTTVSAAVGSPPKVPGDRSPPSSGSVHSVSRALSLLELLASRRDGATAKEIAAHLDVALPSTYHLLTTLIDSGYVVHLAQQHRYGLGYRIRVLDEGLAHQLEAPAAVVEAIRWLHVETDAAAYYAVYRDVDVVIAHVVDSERRPRVRVLDVGFHEAAHATAFGKVMLAAMSPEQRDAYIARAGLRRCTSRTIVDRPSLETHLALVQTAQLAVEFGEFQNGLACLAAPVRSADGSVVASVAVSMPCAEFGTRRWAVEQSLRHGAAVVTRALRAAEARERSS